MTTKTYSTGRSLRDIGAAWRAERAEKWFPVKDYPLYEITPHGYIRNRYTSTILQNISDNGIIKDSVQLRTSGSPSMLKTVTVASLLRSSVPRELLGLNVRKGLKADREHDHRDDLEYRTIPFLPAYEVSQCGVVRSCRLRTYPTPYDAPTHGMTVRLHKPNTRNTRMVVRINEVVAEVWGA